MLRSRISWVLAALAVVGVSLATPRPGTAHPQSAQSTARPTMAERKLQLIARDKQPVPGWLREVQPEGSTLQDTSWRKTANAVVLLHMFRSDHTAWEPILDEFAAKDITTLAIDMRGHGENLEGPEGEDLGAKVRGRDAKTFQAMYHDANAAIDWLVENGYSANRIGLLGASVGCSISIDTARRREGLGPVGVLTPGLNYLGVNSAEHITEWGTRDLLIVTSEEEAAGGPAPLHTALESQLAARRRKSPGADNHVSYWVLEQESIHGTRMFGVVEGIEARIVAWFEERFRAGRLANSKKATSRPTVR